MTNCCDDNAPIGRLSKLRPVNVQRLLCAAKVFDSPRRGEAMRDEVMDEHAFALVRKRWMAERRLRRISLWTSVSADAEVGSMVVLIDDSDRSSPFSQPRVVHHSQKVDVAKISEGVRHAEGTH